MRSLRSPRLRFSGGPSLGSDLRLRRHHPRQRNARVRVAPPYLRAMRRGTDCRGVVRSDRHLVGRARGALARAAVRAVVAAAGPRDIPARSIAIEDSAPGIAAARAAGMKAIAIPHPLTEGHDLAAADLRVSHAGELTVARLATLLG